MVIAAFVALFTCSYFLLWRPSLQGKYEVAHSEVQNPHALALHDFGEKLLARIFRLSNIAGFVGGSGQSTRRSVWLETYPQPKYQGNVVRHDERAGDVVIDKSGRFDFGDLMPGEYDLLVTYPGEVAVGFQFVIDPAHSQVCPSGLSN